MSQKTTHLMYNIESMTMKFIYGNLERTRHSDTYATFFVRCLISPCDVSDLINHPVNDIIDDIT